MLPGCVYSKGNIGQTYKLLGQWPRNVLKTIPAAMPFCCVLGSAFLLRKKNKIICLHWIVSYRIQWRFQLLDGCSSVACAARGTALKHKGPWGRARWRVRVQVLTGLFCHDELVLCLPINHCFPLTHLKRRQPVITNGCQSSLPFIVQNIIILCISYSCPFLI